MKSCRKYERRKEIMQKEEKGSSEGKLIGREEGRAEGK